MRLNPKDFWALKRRGDTYSSLGETDKAVADYTAAIRLNPDFAVAYRERGNIHFSKERYGDAIADYAAALRLNSKDAWACNGRGAAYSWRAEHDKAIADYNAALRLDPKYAMAYLNRSRSYTAKGDTARARADRDQARKLDNSLVAADDKEIEAKKAETVTRDLDQQRKMAKLQEDFMEASNRERARHETMMGIIRNIGDSGSGGGSYVVDNYTGKMVWRYGK